MKFAGRWIAGVVIALDILLASFIGAHHGETVSHYAERHLDSWGGPVCAALGAIDPDHCAKVRF